KRSKKKPPEDSLEARLDKLPRRGLSKEKRQEIKAMREMLGSEPLLSTARKQRKPGQIPLSQVAELENVRPTYRDIEKLAESIKEVGLIHPLIIRPAKQRKLSEKGRV